MRVIKEVITMLEGLKKDNSEQDSAGKNDDDDDILTCSSVCEDSPGICSYLLTFCSLLIIMATLPFSLLYTVKVVQVMITLLCSCDIIPHYFRYYPPQYKILSPTISDIIHTI